MKRRTLAIAAVTAVTLALAAPPASATTTARPATAAPAVAALAAPDVQVSNVQAHLAQLQSIATSNGGNRRAGSAGYTASVAYVKSKLQAAGYTVTEQTCTSCTYQGNNVIAEWPQGPTTDVVMFGAHLDGVAAGPGINDNGSGSSVLLENALVLAQQNPTMTKRVRFAWWNGEEQGLQGSKFYVNSLTTAQKGYIKGYYNFDMVSSTNGGYFINRLTSTTSAPLKAYWDSLGLSPEENVEGQGRSDDYSFQRAGIPTSGYAMGASARRPAPRRASGAAPPTPRTTRATTRPATPPTTSTPPGSTAAPTASRTPSGIWRSAAAPRPTTSPSRSARPPAAWSGAAPPPPRSAPPPPAAAHRPSPCRPPVRPAA